MSGNSFGSALIGGAIVAAFGWVAISAGWIASDGGTTTVSSTATAPIQVKDGGDTNLVNEIYRRDGDGVAFIEATLAPEESSGFNPFGQPEEGGGGGVATGSGFLIDTEGHIVTNAHVVEGAEKVRVKLGDEETSRPAKVIGTDPATDVALIQVDEPADQQHPLALGDSSKVEVGDPVVAIGNPFGLDRTVTSGIVSALQRQIQAPNGFSISHVIQTDAAINPGNSGGPLIDASGSVIGINSQIQTNGGNGNVGIGFAVPIDTAREVVEQLQRDGEVKHAYIGIEGGSVTPPVAKALKLPASHGVLINKVTKDGPAEKAGLVGGDTEVTVEGAQVRVGGDIITEIDGEPIDSMEGLIDSINGARPGDELKLTVVHDNGDEEQVTVTLGVRPESAG